MKILEVLSGIVILEIGANVEEKVDFVTNDSRKVAKNTVFVAIKGYAQDGNKYINQAIENGAKLIITDSKDVISSNIPYVLVENARFAESKVASNLYNNPSKNLQVIGVTGTNGKTTSTHYIKDILDNLGQKTGLIGTNQNIIGDKVTQAERTTEDAVTLQKMLRDLVVYGGKYLVMEVSSHALELNRVDDIDFAVAGYTNLTQDHLDFHNTLEEYAKAKAKLFAKSENSIINLDDKFAKTMIANAKCDVLTYGIENENADLNATNLVLKADKVEFLLEFDNETVNVTLNAVGEFNVYNSLVAIGTVLKLGYKIEDIVKALSKANGVKGRAEVVPVNEDYSVIIDYAHTPDGVLNILKTVKDFAKGRVITLLGCGGDRDKTKRPLMAKAMEKYSDISVVTTDNPRTENPSEIIKDMLVGFIEGKTQIEVVENRKEAIEFAMNIAKKDDVVMLLGKGHETYQEINGQKFDFDERRIVLDIGEKRGKNNIS